FWRQDIPHRARTLWWRLLHKHLPVATFRHAKWRHPSPLCPQCDIEDETIEHAYASCLDKRFAWIDFLRLYTTRQIWTYQDIFSLLSFDPSDFDIAPEHNITKAQLIAAGLLGVKARNDKFYLEETTIPQTAILAVMTSSAETIIRQNNLRR
ncbi:MAG: hypothetical protein J3Q66DRAFT_429059, partial [Benniella sp.]